MTEPYGFKTVERIMAPVIWLMDLIIKLTERIFKAGRGNKYILDETEEV